MTRDLVVVDTDLAIDFLGGRGPGADLLARLRRERRLWFAAPTAFELRVGADFASRSPVIETLLDRRTLPMDKKAAIAAGAVFAGLQAAGRPIGTLDCLLAGVCLRYGLPLATRSRRHFERVADLTLLDIET